jgi:hypothetical protein
MSWPIKMREVPVDGLPQRHGTPMDHRKGGERQREHDVIEDRRFANAVGVDLETVSAIGVNRRPKLTPDRRSKLTPCLVVARNGSARPGGAGRGCAAGASAVRFAV